MSHLAMRQILALSYAECRGAGRRLVFFIICLAIGVGSIMTIKNFSNILDASVLRESKGLLSADLEVSGSWEQTPRDLEFQKQTLPSGSEFVFIKELHAMARTSAADIGEPAGPGFISRPSSLMVELKAVPASPPLYPLYGKLVTRPEGYLPDLLAEYGALVEPSFLVKTSLRVGDSFQLGKVTLRIAGEITAEPDRVSKAFSIGPRVMVSLQTLTDSALVQPGSRIKHRTLIRLPVNAFLDTVQTLLEKGLADKSLMVRSYKDMQSSLTDSIERIGHFLGAVAIIALLMGGIGIAMIVRTFMAQKLDTIAIMKCLGFSSGNIFKVYLLQSLILGLAGSLLGVGLGYGLQYLLPPNLTGLLDVSIQPEFYWRSAGQSLLLGLAATLLFVLWPLLSAVKTRPLRLFRHVAEGEEDNARHWREYFKVGVFFFVSLSLLVLWQAGSLRRGFIFVAALAISISILRGAAFVAFKVLRRLPPSHQMTRRYGLANLYRPNSQAGPIITALGIGIMLVLSARLVQMDTIAMLKENTDIKPPNFFFIDIQSDQKDVFVSALNRVAPMAERELTPLIRSRLHGIDDRTADKWEFKNPGDEEWFVHREFVLTYSEKLPAKGNTIVSGNWWTAEEAGQQLVSLEEDAARRLGARIGSKLVMDIQGVPVSATVTNIRRVDWRNMRTNFYMIFSPGALEGVPVTFVGTVRVGQDKEGELLAAVVSALPNVTALSTRDIINTVESVTGKLLRLVDFMSGFTIMAGLFILSGAVASTKFRRLKEAAILKTLGADRGMVASILAYEYAALGIIAALIGVALSQLLSWAVMTYLIKTHWHLRPAPIIWSFLLAVTLTALTGLLSSLDVLNNKPFQTLRKLDG